MCDAIVSKNIKINLFSPARSSYIHPKTSNITKDFGLWRSGYRFRHWLSGRSKSAGYLAKPKRKKDEGIEPNQVRNDTRWWVEYFYCCARIEGLFYQYFWGYLILQMI